MIPRIIHHIAPVDTNAWHPFWAQCRQSWIDAFPNYDHVLWNDSEDLDRIVRDHYPRYWNLYRSFPVHIMRIDFARLCILHRYGGIYADMDYFCYGNFEDQLTDHSIYLVENLTEEFTSATVENSLMAAEENNKFFLDTMNYVQACYIQFRNRFKFDENGHWKNSDNGFIVNNTTGSGMLTVARESYGRALYDIGHLNTAQFNNRPSSYADWFKAKHVHTNLWGNDQLDATTSRVFIVDGNAYLMNEIPNHAIERAKNSGLPYYTMTLDEYDFRVDYTHDKYLQKDNGNLDSTKRFIAESEQTMREIMIP